MQHRVNPELPRELSGGVQCAARPRRCTCGVLMNICKRTGAAIGAAAVVGLGALAVTVGVTQPASAAVTIKLDQASTSTTAPPPTTLATASASPTDKAPPFGKK